MKLNIGIKKESLNALGKLLNGLVADELLLLAKTKKFHWNVTGPHFNTLHLMFDKQYTELAPMIDEMAERTRSLGVKSVGGLTETAKLSVLKDSEGDPDYKVMLTDLLTDHETVIRRLREAIDVSGDEYNDANTADLLTKIMEWHEKTAWMIRSLLE